MAGPAQFNAFPRALRDLAPFGPYRAVVDRVVDGDTFYALIDLGLNEYSYQSIRLKDVNTPELNSRDPAERAKGVAARQFVAAILTPGKGVVLQTDKDKSTFGRYVADVFYLSDDEVSVSLADVVIRAGHGERVEY